MLVKKFLSKEAVINWPKQIKLAKQLLELYPNIDFWDKATPPDENIWSLAWFLTEAGTSFLKNQHLIQNTTEDLPQHNYNFKKEKIGEDFTVNKKTKNPLDFY